MPEISDGEWLEVSGIDGVVGHVYPKEKFPLVGIVVFRPDKPTFRDFIWDGSSFKFSPAQGDFGGYAKRVDKYNRHVAKLLRGRYGYGS